MSRTVSICAGAAAMAAMVMLTAPGQAAAADARKAAARKMEAGTEAFNDERYEEALAAFQEAAALVPDAAGPLRAVGAALRYLDRCDEALPPLKRFLERKGPDTAESEEVKANIAHCERVLTKRTSLTVTASVDGASIRLDRVDGTFLGTTPLAGTRVSPGDHTLHVTADGHRPTVAAVTAELGKDTAIHVELTPVTDAATPPPKRKKTRKGPGVGVWIGVGVGAAVLVVGGVVLAAVLVSGGSPPDVELSPPFRL